MQEANEHPREAQRLAALFDYEVLDSEEEANFDELTELASAICSAPISLISLVDDHRQWFKSRCGLDATETQKGIAFCSHAILQTDVFEIPDATQDARFADNPLVTGAPDIRFYAGAPLVTPSGDPVGTLCVIDTNPKTLTEDQKRALQILSRQVITQLELRKQRLRLEHNQKQQQNMLTTIAHDLRSPFNGILGIAKVLSEKAEKMPLERVVKHAHQILGSSLSVYQLLDEMLQWSTQRLQGQASELTEQALAPLIDSSFELLKEALLLKRIHYSQDVDPSAVVIADATMTKAVTRNLLNNAIKFTPEGGEISVESVVQAHETHIKIYNTGESIPDDMQAALFESPLKSESGTAGEHGTGLGLSLCKEFMRAQNGRIWYDTHAKGSCFSFSLNNR